MAWTTVPALPAVHVPSAAEWAAYKTALEELRPLSANRTANHAGVSASTTLVADAVLAVTAAAGATYRWVLDAIYTAAAAGGIRLGLTFPAGASCSMRGIGYLAGSTTWQNTNASIGSATSAAAGTSGTVGTSVLTYGSGVGDIGVQLSGRLTTGASGGTVQVVYAQAASDATATVIRTGSTLTLTRVG